MDITCPQCSHLHEVDDLNAAGKRIYFFCTKCGHKIVVDSRKETTPTPVVTEFSHISDILYAVPQFFNKRGFLLSFLFTTITLLFVITASLIMYKVTDIDAGVRAVLLFLFWCTVYYAYLLLLYFLSKYHYQRNSIEAHRQDQSVFSNFGNDSLALFFVSFVFSIVTVFLILPIVLLRDTSLLYGAFFFPIILFACITIFIFLIMHQYFPAFLALHSYKTAESFKHFIVFMRREFLTIPFHFASICVVFVFYAGILSFIFYSMFFLVYFGCTVFSLPALSSSGVQGSFFNLGSVLASYSTYSALLYFFAGLCLTVFISLLISARQTLFAHSTAILSTTPHNSLSKRSILIVLAVTAFIAFSLFMFFALYVKIAR